MISEQIKQLQEKNREQHAQISSLMIQVEDQYEAYYKRIAHENNKANSLCASKKSKLFSFTQLFSKVIIHNIILNLNIKQIIDMRRISQQFNQLILICLPFIKDRYEKKIEIIQSALHIDELQKQEALLQYVNFSLFKEDLKERVQFDNRNIRKENIFCINLLFDLISFEKPPWRKAKYTFQMKVNAIVEQMNKNSYFLQYFCLADQEVEELRKNQNFDFRHLSPYNEYYDEVVTYVQNLLQIASLQHYEQLRFQYSNQAEINSLTKEKQRMFLILQKGEQKKQSNQ